MRKRARRIILGAASVLSMIAIPEACAQVIDLSGSAPITDIVIADTPQTFIDDQVLSEALRKAIDAGAVSGSAFDKGDVQGAVVAAFGVSASSIIDTFDLGGVPGLQFGTTGNKVAVEQDGQRNLVRIDQTRSSAGWAVINQAGEDGSTSVFQADTGAPGQASLNRAYVGQVGSATPSGSNLYSNFAEVAQTHQSFDVTAASFSGSNLVNSATIQQGGFRNLNLQQVPVPVNAVGARNRARMEQQGGGNDGIIQQGLESPGTFVFELGDTIGRENRAMLTQVGNGNRGVILQEDDAIAITRQYGADNVAFLRQDGDVMDGGQYSLIDQGALEDGDARDNFAAVFQRGNRQESTVLQRGADNAANVFQTAESGYARSTINQRGSGNFASLMQLAAAGTVGEGVSSAIAQDGALNEAFITQRVAGSRSSVSQVGARNFASVRQ